MTIELPNVDTDVAHTLVHYLYADSYQTLQTRDASEADINATEYTRGLKAYCAARWYNLSGLEALAKERIEQLSGAVPALAALDRIKTAFSTAPANDQWLPGYLDKELKRAFRVDDALFTTAEFADRVGGVSAFDRAVVKSVARILKESLHAGLAHAEDTPHEEFVCKIPLAPGCAGAAADAKPEKCATAPALDCANALSDEPPCEVSKYETLASERPCERAESCKPYEESYEEVSKDAECAVPSEPAEECLPCEPEDACHPYESEDAYPPYGEPRQDPIMPEEVQELEPQLKAPPNDDAKPEELAVPECPPDEAIYSPSLSKKDRKGKNRKKGYRWDSEVGKPIDVPPIEAPNADMPDEHEAPLPQDCGLEATVPMEEEIEKQDYDDFQPVEEKAQRTDDLYPLSFDDSAQSRSSRGTMSSQLDCEGLCDNAGTHLLFGKGWKECSRCSALVRLVAAQRAREVDSDGGFEIM